MFFSIAQNRKKIQDFLHGPGFCATHARYDFQIFQYTQTAENSPFLGNISQTQPGQAVRLVPRHFTTPEIDVAPVDRDHAHNGLDGG